MISSWLSKALKGFLYFFFLSQVLFGLWSFLPSDHVDITFKDGASLEEKNALRDDLGLSGTFGERWLGFQKEIYSGTWGHSLAYKRSVLGLIGERLPFSFFLALWSVLLSTALSLILTLGFADRPRARKRLSHLGIFLMGFPLIVVAPLALYLFSAKFAFFGILSESFWQPPLLAVLLLAYAQVLVSLRLFLDAAGKIIEQPFFLALRAKGLSRFKIHFVHLFKNLVPVLGLQMAQLSASVLTGSLVIEILFEIPGLGLLFQEALLARDFPLVHGLVMVFASIYIVAFLVSEYFTERFFPLAPQETV
jgi:ABC-type dipeptide/oligopeptide/nickel transport system permease component